MQPSQDGSEFTLANASARTLPARQRLWCRAYPALGVAGCALLALSLPVEAVLGGLGLLALSLPVEAVLGGLGLLAGGALVYRVRAPRGGADRGR